VGRVVGRTSVDLADELGRVLQRGRHRGGLRSGVFTDPQGAHRRTRLGIGSHRAKSSADSKAATQEAQESLSQSSLLAESPTGTMTGGERLKGAVVGAQEIPKGKSRYRASSKKKKKQLQRGIERRIKAHYLRSTLSISQGRKKKSSADPLSKVEDKSGREDDSAIEDLDLRARHAPVIRRDRASR